MHSQHLFLLQQNISSQFFPDPVSLALCTIGLLVTTTGSGMAKLNPGLFEGATKETQPSWSSVPVYMNFGGASAPSVWERNQYK